MRNMLYLTYSSKNLYHIAAKYSLIEILKQANPYDLNLRDDSGRTPIHYAALKGNLACIRVILGLGGKIQKCDLFGNSTLHYAVRSRNLNCILFLINYEPKLVLMMDINNLTAKGLAEALEFYDIAMILDEFYYQQMRLDMEKFYKLQMREIKQVKKRRVKYLSLMKNAAKNQLEEYKKKKLYRFQYGSKVYLAYDKIVVDDNFTLSTNDVHAESNSIKSNKAYLVGCCTGVLNRKNKSLRAKLNNKSANQASFA